MDKEPTITKLKDEGLETPHWGAALALLLGFFLILLNPAVVIFGLLESLNIELGNETVSRFVTIVGYQLVTIGFIYWFIRARKNTLKSIRLQMPKINDLLQGVFAFIPYFILTVGVMIALRIIFPEVNFDQEQEIGFQSAQTTLDLILVYIVLAIIVPISEEMLFRGILLQGFLRRTAPFIAILITSILFGLAHFQLNVSIDTFVFGLFLGTVTVMTKNLWPAILLHSIKNSLAFLSLFILT